MLITGTFLVGCLLIAVWVLGGFDKRRNIVTYETPPELDVGPLTAVFTKATYQERQTTKFDPANKQSKPQQEWVLRLIGTCSPNGEESTNSQEALRKSVLLTDAAGKKVLVTGGMTTFYIGQDAVGRNVMAPGLGKHRCIIQFDPITDFSPTKTLGVGLVPMEYGDPDFLQWGNVRWYQPAGRGYEYQVPLEKHA